MKKSLPLIIIILFSACSDSNKASDTDKEKNNKIEDSFSDGSYPDDNENQGQDLPTTIEGNIPEVLSFRVSADPMYPNSYNAYHLTIDKSAAPYYFLVWDVEELGDPIEDQLIKIEELETNLFNLYTHDDMVYELKKNASSWVMEDDEKGERYFLTADSKSSDMEVLSDEELDEKMKFMNDYPKVITDREQMKDILLKTGFASNEKSDPKMLHHEIHQNDDGSYYYDPCEDWTGYISEAFEISGSDDYTGITEEDQPSFYSSSQDTYAWKIEQFEKTPSGFKFNLMDYNRGGKRYLELSKYGFWIFKTDYDGKIVYRTTEKNIKQLPQEPDDCPDRYNEY